jgi:hypothetical protein
MKRKLVYDDLSASGPKRPFNPLASKARSDVDSALKELCDALGLEHERVADAVNDILEQHEGEQVQAHAQSLGAAGGKGAGARDEDDDADNDDDFAQRVRKYLSGKGLDPKSIDQAIEIAVRNRAAGIDERPQNAVRGGFGGKLSTKDEVEAEYGGSHILDLPDYSPDPDRDRLPGYRQSVYAASERAMRQVAGGGVGRRIDTPPGASDAAICASDEEMEALYPGIENVIAGV